jgi:glycosyltransferase involved in cell wall biosynthesis
MTYNHEEFIARAIDSCLNQSYKNIEICIADDFSTDDTVEIIREYQRSHKNIKLTVQRENMGVHSLAINGNSALSMCNGDYIAILDGDEEMLPDRLQKQLDFLVKNSEYIAVSHKKIELNTKTGEEIYHKVDGYDVTTKDLILKGNIFSHCQMMRNISHRFNNSLRVMLDWESIIQLSFMGKLYVQPESLTRKFIHGENVTINRKDQIHRDFLQTLSILEFEHPKLVHLLNVKRTQFYISRLLLGNKSYIKPLLSQGLFNIVGAFYYKLMER